MVKNKSPKPAIVLHEFHNLRDLNMKEIETKVFVLFYLATDKEDIIDEAIKYFRANIFFRNYDIKVNCCSILNEFN